SPGARRRPWEVPRENHGRYAMSLVQLDQHNAERFDQTVAEAFMERLGGHLDSGAIAIMVSVGHRTGLFDVMARMPPAGSAEITEEAGLAERYVREWLAVMVTARIVTYSPALATYHLPAEHAACLTRGAALGNMAVYGQHVTLLGVMQERLLECFRSGEGLRYEDY